MEYTMEDSDFTGVPHLEVLTRSLEPVVDKSESDWIDIIIGYPRINRVASALRLADKYDIKASREIFDGLIDEVVEELPDIDLSSWLPLFEHILTD